MGACQICQKPEYVRRLRSQNKANIGSLDNSYNIKTDYKMKTNYLQDELQCQKAEKIKMVVLGDTFTGKSSLIRRYLRNDFDQNT